MAVAQAGPTAHLRSILILPFNVLVVIPAALLWRSSAWRLALPAEPRFWIAIACFAAGLALMAVTIRLFVTRGEGTLAPWNPTQKLVVVGVYRHVRNPMITGVLLNLLGETLLFGSRSIALWCAIFFVANAIYLPLSEEPGLEARFGDAYRRYRAAVPRWIPRRTPWTDAGSAPPERR